MKAMIFAAGLGTRLKPLTDHMPKALVPIGGKPLLEIVIKRLMQAGFDDLIINIHHFADQIEEWARTSDFMAQHGDALKIHFSDERKDLLETGGGVRHARPLLRGCDRFLIHNVDILSNVNLQAFYAYGQGAVATLLVSDRPTQRYLLFNDDMRLVGWTNLKTGELKSPYPDLIPHRCHRLAFAGIHQMDTSILPLMDAWPDHFSIIDFYLSLCAKYKIHAYIQPGLRLMDVGKLNTLAEAETFANTYLCI
ncbi:MAG: NTP transferase domain-containing protein [Bacteroidaceae bacterium]|nr:NTP transferase domain-containing protein [Bacteroidaceae bacterium]